MGDAIAVGVSDSSASRRAVEWAIHRAVRSSAQLLLISVVGSDSGAAGERGVVERALAGAELLLDQLTRRASEHGLTAEAVVDRGDPLARLVAASERAALLVVGSDRFTGSRRRRGPLAMRVSGEAHCPVVVVPDRDVEGNAGVVVGVDGSEISERAIRFAAEEAERHDEELIAVKSWSPMPMPMQIGTLPSEYLAAAQQLAEEELAISLAGLRQDLPDLRVRTVVEPEYPAALLRRIGAGARMVVAGSHGRGALRRFLLGSTTQLLLEEPPTVVAVVR
ncbi:universal stress protein [Microbacterium sp. CFH 31415]|uniref:universal stress protein n=1 Tax=Microbacterium sp. CFH 31415 TaxID=2921732 RepID=UPI001F13555F|nr:universal stress protein [Microbacterium sp. CFH 31415]MCH6230998.1 universal stress protein [Microbacterium sp. CFH 31415]